MDNVTMFLGLIVYICSYIGQVWSVSSNTPVVACYFTNWAQYRSGLGKYDVSHIDPFLCTDIVYAFANIDQDNYRLKTFEYNDEDLYSQIMALKTTNPALNVHLAVGGWAMGTHPFKTISASEIRAKLFAQNTITFLRTHGFDGLNLDWEYPAHKTKFTMLCRVLFEMFTEEAQRTGKPRLLLTAAVAAFKEIVPFYEPQLSSQYLDYIYVMAYDYFDFESTKIGHNSPLYVRPEDKNNTNAAMLSQNASMTLWNELGAPKDKLVMGIACYGRTFQMAGPKLYNVGDPSGGVGEKGSFTDTPGFLAYFEICEMLQTNILNRRWMADSKVPFAYGVLEGQWTYVGYDDVESMEEKAAYIVSQGLAGAMFWTLDFDDFDHGVCGEGKYPLIGTMKEGLGGQVVTSRPATTGGVNPTDSGGVNPTNPECTEGPELVYLVDKSASMTKTDWYLVKQFAENKIENFDIDEEGGHELFPIHLKPKPYASEYSKDELIQAASDATCNICNRDLPGIGEVLQYIKDPCELGWIFDGVSQLCYKFNDNKVNQQTAVKACYDEFGTLPQINSNADHKFIASISKGETWLDLKHEGGDGIWRWGTTGEALTYSNWNRRQPNGQKKKEYCAVMSKRFLRKWEDVKCNNKASYVCIKAQN